MPEERPDLLNFLYSDKDIINSFYAQLFNGLTKHIEQTETSQVDGILEIKGGIKIATGGATGKALHAKADKEIIDPHDVILLDVINELGPSIKSNITETTIGDIVLVHGNVYVMDKQILLAGLDCLISIEDGNLAGHKDKKSKKKDRAIYDFLKKIIDAYPGDAKFVMHTKDGDEITGTLKLPFLMESITSACLKFGGNPMQACYVLGIVDGVPGEAAFQNPFPSGTMDFPAIETMKAFRMTAGRSEHAYAMRPISIFSKINL